MVSISWVISLLVNFNLDCNSGTVAWNSLVIDWNSVLIVSLMSFSIFWWHSEWWLMRIAVNWRPHSIRQSFQCLVNVTRGLVIPNLQTGVHPCGMFPLLTRLPIVLMVTAVLQRELIDGLRLFTNVLSLLLILTTGELCSVMLASVLGELLMVWY